MNMVEFVAQAIQQVEETNDLKATDNKVILRGIEARMGELIANMDEAEQHEIETVCDDLRTTDKEIAYSEGFSQGIRFIFTALLEGRRY